MEANKTTVKSSHSTKTVLDKIIYAIRNQPPTAGPGVSRTSISKFLKTELDYENLNALKAAFKKGVTSGKLVQIGQSFRVQGDVVPVHPTPADKVKIEDVEEGAKGASVASRNDTVVVSYEGKLSDGTIFDSAKSFEFQLGAGDVIKGWDQGIVGMKIGGTRKLHVPSKLGYGKRGSSPEIPPNSDLFFTVTLKKIK
jgi:FKBP-type peptidyl-prolyl cis-trans isomerase